MNWLLKTAIGAAATTLAGGLVVGGYQGILLAGDSRWVRQDAFVASQKQSQRLQIQRMMVPLEVKEQKGTITDAERALLQTYRKQVEELNR